MYHMVFTMKHTLFAMAFATMAFSLSVMAFSRAVRDDLCAAGSKQIGGNWYCQAVDAVRYTNVGTSGSYDRVIDMKPDGTCVTESHAFSGPLSPLNEEVRSSSTYLRQYCQLTSHVQVSLHFRGPIQLKQFAVYTPASSTGFERKVKHRSYVGGHRHGHNVHKRESSVQPGQSATATIKGQVVHWANDWSGGKYSKPR